MTEDTRSEPPKYTIVKFRLLTLNYEKLFSAAALNGEDRETVLNRAVAFYELLHRAEPGNVLSWIDVDNQKRRLLVLAPLRKGEIEIGVRILTLISILVGVLGLGLLVATAVTGQWWLFAGILAVLALTSLLIWSEARR
jgi:hypothetical protein